MTTAPAASGQLVGSLDHPFRCRIPNRIRDQVGCIIRRLVGPKTEYLPTGSLQSLGASDISSTVGLELCSPPCGIRLWPGSVLWTPMPEASVEIDSYTS